MKSNMFDQTSAVNFQREISQETAAAHVKRLEHGHGLDLPQRIRLGDAAIDLPSAETLNLAPFERLLVPTGFALALPEHYCGLILSRSGLALNHGVVVLNSPGLIDSGYRGELKVLLINHGAEIYKIERGDRIAQLLIQWVPNCVVVEADSLPESPDRRGTDGFGSSGM